MRYRNRKRESAVWQFDGRYIDAAIVRGLYGAFPLTTGLRVTHQPDYEGALERSGFRKQRETMKLGGLLVASLWRKA